MRTLLRSLSLAAASTLALGAAAAQQSMTLSGEIDETFGEDGFILVLDGTEVAVATGQLYDENPQMRLSRGDQVVVYALPTAEFFADRIVDADGLYLVAPGRLLRVRESALPDTAYAARGADEADEARSPRAALAERRNSRSDDASRRRGERMAARPAAADEDERETSRSERRRAEREERRAARAPAPAGPAESEDFDEFASYDRNGDGVLTMSEYVRLAAQPENISRSEASRLFEALARGDRLMTRKEFLDPPERYTRLSERFLSN